MLHGAPLSPMRQELGLSRGIWILLPQFLSHSGLPRGTTEKQGLRVVKERMQSFESLSVRRTEQGSFHRCPMSSRKQREMESMSLKAALGMDSTPSSGTCNLKLTY